MPTTGQEADKIIELCSKHGMQPKQLLHLARDLHEQVGKDSDNWSVRETMRMIYDRALDEAIKWRPADMTVDDFLLHIGMSRPTGPEVSSKEPVNEAWAINLGQNVWMVLWYCIVIGHVSVWFALLLACVLTTVHQPWYLATPTVSFCLYLLFTDTQCPITRWENAVRRRLGWDEVGHFTHWYVICPLFHGRTCNRKCSALRVGPG